MPSPCRCSLAVVFRGRVLVVDDDYLLVRQVSAVLERDGFYTEFASDGVSALAKLRERGGESFDCAVLDIDMPGLSGLEVLAELRKQGSSLPVLLLTDLTGEIDTVFGFNAGADDYVGKPFRARELVARVRRLLRGSSSQAAPVSVGQGVFDLQGLKVSGPDGEVRVSVTEASLLRPLLSPPGRLVPQAELLAVGWGTSDRRNLRSLYEHIRRIRARLREVGAGVDVKSARNAGYQVESV